MHDLKFYMECSKVGVITSMDRFLLEKRVHKNQETAVQKRDNESNRAAAFAKMQRESILASGFFLSEEQLNIINSTLTETVKSVYTEEEWNSLRNVFAELIRQARTMNIDYLPELEFGLKKILGDRILPRTSIF